MTSLSSGIQHIQGVPNTRLAGASGVLVSAPKKKKKKKSLSLSEAKSASLVARIHTIPLGTYALYLSLHFLCCLLYSTTFHPAALY